MFTIQYEALDGTHRTETFEGKSRTRLTIHLATYTRPIVAVYEQASPITKAVRNDLARWTGGKTRYAKEFTSPR